jgi:hypothetical protein
MDHIRAPIAFTVRVTTGEEREVTAIVQCVRTGEKHRVRGGRAIGALITRLAQRGATTREETHATARTAHHAGNPGLRRTGARRPRRSP